MTVGAVIHPRDRIRVWIAYDVKPWIKRHEEGMALAIARRLPRLLKYWVIIATAVDVSAENPRQEVPMITWDQLAGQLEKKREVV